MKYTIKLQYELQRFSSKKGNLINLALLFHILQGFTDLVAVWGRLNVRPWSLRFWRKNTKRKGLQAKTRR